MKSLFAKRTSWGDRIFYAVDILFMVFMIVITLYPMLYVLFGSFSDPGELSKQTGLLWGPAGFSLDGYKAVLNSPNVWLGYRNTIFYVIVGTVVNMVLTILGAYALSRSNFMLKKPITLIILFTMFFSGGMIPSFLIVRGMGMLNTVWAVIIPGAISTYNMIVLRTSFEGLPDSLMESAKLDGAGEFTLLMRIVLPLSKAALATITLFYAVGRWGEWYSALVYLQQRRDLYPLQMFLRELLIIPTMNDQSYAEALTANATQSLLMKEVIKYSTVVVSTIPILIVYPFLQKYFVKGVMVGAIKG